MAGAIGPIAFSDVDIDRRWSAAHWMGSAWRPGDAAIAPSTSPRRAREECWSSQGPHWSGSTRPTFTETHGSRPVHAVRWAAESSWNSSLSWGGLAKFSVPLPPFPGVRGLVVFPMRPFVTLPRWAIAPTVGTGLRTLWSIPYGDRHGRVSAGPGAAPASGRPHLAARCAEAALRIAPATSTGCHPPLVATSDAYALASRPTRFG
jgi:hypothetical protein